MRRLIPALTLGLVTFLAACGTGTGPGASPSAPATSAPADPVAVITDSMARSIEGPMSLDARIGSGREVVEITAALDPSTGEMTVTLGAPEPMQMLVTKDALYVQEDESEGGKWLRFDRSRLKPGGPLSQGIDVRSQAGILGGVVSAEPVGDGRYTGIADVDKAIAAAESEMERDSLEAAAKVVKDRSKVPFEATVDAEGRLTALSYTFDTSAGKIKTELTMHSFGKPVTVTPPPATQTEDAPDELYQFF